MQEFDSTYPAGKEVDAAELPNYGLRDAGRVQLGDSALGYGETGWYMYSKVPHIEMFRTLCAISSNLDCNTIIRNTSGHMHWNSQRFDVSTQ